MKNRKVTIDKAALLVGVAAEADCDESPALMFAMRDLDGCM